MSIMKRPVTHHVIRTGEGIPFVVLGFRERRMPIQKVIVTASGVIELLTSDGTIETLGTLDHPCDADVLLRIRTHHEGLLLVQIDPTRVKDGVQEQLLSARFG